MSLRELSLCETTCISGAGSIAAGGGWQAFEATRNGFRDIAENYSSTQAEYNGKDWHYVVAVDPVLSGLYTAVLSKFGFDGKATLAKWAKTYA